MSRLGWASRRCRQPRHARQGPAVHLGTNSCCPSPLAPIDAPREHPHIPRTLSDPSGEHLAISRSDSSFSRRPHRAAQAPDWLVNGPGEASTELSAHQAGAKTGLAVSGPRDGDLSKVMHQRRRGVASHAAGAGGASEGRRRRAAQRRVRPCRAPAVLRSPTASSNSGRRGYMQSTCTRRARNSCSPPRLSASPNSRLQLPAPASKIPVAARRSAPRLQNARGRSPTPDVSRHRKNSPGLAPVLDAPTPVCPPLSRSHAPPRPACEGKRREERLPHEDLRRLKAFHRRFSPAHLALRRATSILVPSLVEIRPIRLADRHRGPGGPRGCVGCSRSPAEIAC